MFTNQWNIFILLRGCYCMSINNLSICMAQHYPQLFHWRVTMLSNKLWCIIFKHCINATMQNINVLASTRCHHWGAHSMLTMHFKMYQVQRYNCKKIRHFGTHCHHCQFYAFWDAYGEQDCTPDSYVAYTTSSYLMWPTSVRMVLMHCELCMAQQHSTPWIGPCLGCHTIYCVLIFPYRVPTTLFTSSMCSVNPYDMINCLHSLYHMYLKREDIERNLSCHFC